VPGGTAIPAQWQEEVRERGLRTVPPTRMSEVDNPAPVVGDAEDGTPAYRPWEPGGEGPLDHAIAATRDAVYPLHGLDPEDPRD
jgi:acetoin utilization protein AcuC